MLAYRAHEVPVGEDQREHLELMRDVARRFNARFGEDILVVPEHRIPEIGGRIMDLQEPANKMSTTGGTAEGTVLVLDDPATIEKKIKRAVTDSGSDIVRAPDKPGVTNLIDILAVARGVAPQAVEQEMRSARGYGDLKAATAQAVIEMLAPLREATPSCAATSSAWRRSSPTGPRRPARWHARRWATCATPWASAPRGASTGVRRLALLVGAIVLVDTMFYAAITPLLPQLADDFELGKNGAGVLAGAYAAGTLIGALPGGWLAARVGVQGHRAGRADAHVASAGCLRLRLVDRRARRRRASCRASAARARGRAAWPGWPARHRASAAAR